MRRQMPPSFAWTFAVQFSSAGVARAAPRQARGTGRASQRGPGSEPPGAQRAPGASEGGRHALRGGSFRRKPWVARLGVVLSVVPVDGAGVSQACVSVGQE